MTEIYRGCIRSGIRAAVAVLSVSLLAGGCANECKTASECGALQQCVAGECAALAVEDETDRASSDSSRDPETETATESGVGDPSDSDTGLSGTESESDSDAISDSDEVGTDVEPVFGENRDGQSCESAADCASGYCESDLCCLSGICCPEPGNGSDCPGVLCKKAYCDGNYQCRYFDLPLGSVDPGVETSCDGDDRCNGSGDCVEVSFCDAEAYKGTGEILEEGNALVETCRVTCEKDTHCNVGYRCSDGACLPVEEGSDTHCQSDKDCSAGRCDTDIHVCCASGDCCLSDVSCGRYACDVERRMCHTTCRLDYQDVDAACSSAGEYHCDSGWCYDDLENGDKWCDEASDCRSGYCDSNSATCCTEDACCVTDDDCGGMRCLVDEGNFCPDTCAPDGIDDDSLCRPYYLCQDGTCVSGALRNGEACDDSDMCESGWCEGGRCCDSGECCLEASDCEADEMCNVAVCGGSHQCIYYAHSCGAEDIEGEVTCEGDERCDGFGNCVDVSACEGGFAGEAFVCTSGVVAVDCSTACDSDDECTAAYHCEDEACLPDLLPGEIGCDNNRDCRDAHCNVETEVCCVSGYCCAEDADCAVLFSTCDPETHACRVDCEEDGDCAPLGAFHCTSGVCEPDLLNGDRYCLENSECVSDYCDTETGICCEEGTCCMSDAACGGFACDEGYSCVTDCTGDDNLCADGWFCNLEFCEPRRPNGALCESDLDCASEHCGLESGVCCDGEGNCCLNDSDCESESECASGYCTASFSCAYRVKEDGESCGDGLFCNGDERCSDGVCTSGETPCSDGGVCLETVCDEELDDCLEIPVNEGEDCSEPMFCLGNVAMKCTDMGVCADPGTGVPPCAQESESFCIEQVCNEAANRCDAVPKADGVPCLNDPCEGTAACESGECVLFAEPPCDDGDPCTTDSCSTVEGNPVCGDSTPKADGDPCEADVCMGEGATCYAGSCVPAQTRPCADGNLCTVDECEAFGGDYECGSESRSVREIGCGETISVAGYEFSREVYSYNEVCPGDYSGMEIALVVNNAAGDVTFVVAETVPEIEIEVLHLSDRCDRTSCTAHGTGSLAVQAVSDQPVFVLESPGIAPPSVMEVSVTCE